MARYFKSQQARNGLEEIKKKNRNESIYVFYILGDSSIYLYMLKGTGFVFVYKSSLS